MCMQPAWAMRSTRTGPARATPNFLSQHDHTPTAHTTHSHQSHRHTAGQPLKTERHPKVPKSRTTEPLNPSCTNYACGCAVLDGAALPHDRRGASIKKPRHCACVVAPCVPARSRQRPIGAHPTTHVGSSLSPSVSSYNIESNCLVFLC